jgi:nucleoside-diphosphate-sugar epimerase
LFEFVQKNKITQIYHLAAVLSATGEKNPKFAWHLNMDGLIHVLDAAVEFKLDQSVLAKFHRSFWAYNSKTKHPTGYHHGSYNHLRYQQTSRRTLVRVVSP